MSIEVAMIQGNYQVQITKVSNKATMSSGRASIKLCLKWQVKEKNVIG